MTKSLRAATAASEMRPKIIRAALELIEEEGFGAVSAPRLADRIGLRRPIIYYYFRDVDEILIEAVRLSYQTSKEAATESLKTKSAAEVMWDFFSIAAAPLSELVTISLKNDKFKVVYAGIVEDFRSTISIFIEQQYADAGVSVPLSSSSVALLIQIVSSALATESRLGITGGHAELIEFIEALFIMPNAITEFLR